MWLTLVRLDEELEQSYKMREEIKNILSALGIAAGSEQSQDSSTMV